MSFTIPLCPTGRYFIIFALLYISAYGTPSEPCFKAEYASDIGLAKDYDYHPFFTVESATACAQHQDKPILILFTGVASMAYSAWPWELISDKAIRSQIEQHYTFLTLYTDDRRKHPLRSDSLTIGQVNTQLQTTLYNSNAQPMFIIVNSQLQPLSERFQPSNSTTVSQFLDFINRTQ